MTPIDNEVKKYLNKFIIESSTYRVGVKSIGNRLFELRTTKTKLYFLNALRKSVEELKQADLKKNTFAVFGVDKYENAIHIIEEELDVLNENYSPEIKSGDEFSYEEQSNIFSILDNITQQLEKLGYGQEIIFDEIDELKQNINLKRKSWMQLAGAKFGEMVVTHGIKETIIKDGYSELVRVAKITGSNLLGM